MTTEKMRDAWIWALPLLVAGVYACSSDEGSASGTTTGPGQGGGDGVGGSGIGDGGGAADTGSAGASSGTGATGTGTGASGPGTGATGPGTGATGPGTGATGPGTGGSGFVPIEGGGEHAAPLGMGCGPETAGECYPVGEECNGTQALDYQYHADALETEQLCFYGEGQTVPSATIEQIAESYDGQDYIHIRVTFDPDFVDTVYGDCAAQTGWNPNRPHSFRDLRGSDHVELILREQSACGDNDPIAMHIKVDFIHDAPDSPTGYATGGVLEGDGDVFEGDPAHVLAVGTSLDRNMNGCEYEGYTVNTTNSPCPGGEDYQPSPEAPSWDFRMMYEVWIDAAAFPSGFCTVDIEYVHASPSKTPDDTIIVEPEPCPDTPWYGSGGTGGAAGAPSTGGEAGTPPATGGTPSTGGVAGAGGCPDGWIPDLVSEGAFCVPPPEN